MDEASALTAAQQILIDSSKPTTDFATQIGSFSTAESVEDYQFDPSQSKITPTQRSFCALLVRGFSAAAACRELHINYLAACRWKDKAWFEPVCEIERKKWFESKGIDQRTEMLAPLMGLALDSLKESLTSEDDKVRLAAVNLVFEQFFEGGKRPVGRPPHPKNDLPPPPDLSDLRAMAEARILEMNADVASNGKRVDIRANN